MKGYKEFAKEKHDLDLALESVPAFAEPPAFTRHFHAWFRPQIVCGRGGRGERGGREGESGRESGGESGGERGGEKGEREGRGGRRGRGGRGGRL